MTSRKFRAVRGSLISGRILFVGAHCDDIEIGCAGTAAKFQRNGNPIAFAIATPEPTGKKERTRRDEAARAAAMLDLSEAGRTLFFGSFPDQELNQREKEIREWLKTVSKEFNPKTVFIHRHDDHTDHQAIHRVAIGVFQNKNIFLYYIPRPSPETPFDPNYAEDISLFIKRKVSMCKCHASQPPDYIGADTVRTNSHYWYLRWYGRIAPRRDGHAEAFVIRGWRTRLSGEPSSNDTSRVATVRYGLRVVKKPDGSLHWKS